MGCADPDDTFGWCLLEFGIARRFMVVLLEKLAMKALGRTLAGQRQLAHKAHNPVSLLSHTLFLSSLFLSSERLFCEPRVRERNVVAESF